MSNNKKISDFSAVKNADVNNMTAIAGVGTDDQDVANQNVAVEMYFQLERAIYDP